ncbi:unnamed protein product [Musa acuminata subsp. malaccensis]|uniref:(wild Malaysian banana) hypothetical protein n=1 Tax=Musa acuminata subsp. malaccensis TaxID=214687 RepID=A0A8D7F8X2_MUSAM|nr:unnamed protein product [Musa acuminata subsp. malaccensis]
MEEEVEEMVEPAVAVDEEEEEAEVGVQWRGWWGEAPWPRKSGGVMLEGYVDGADSGGDQGPGGFLRTKSLTDEDLKELKGCLDLGFGFSYEEIPELCNTLPALELCYSMTQRFLDDHHHHHHHHQRSFYRSSSGESMDLCASPTSPPIANWRISSPGTKIRSCNPPSPKPSFSLIFLPPGDHPDEVKARLRYWAQAVACTIRLCS